MAGSDAQARWHWYFLLAAVEAAAAFALLVVAPRGSSGFSPARIGVLASLVASFAYWFYCWARPTRIPCAFSHPAAVPIAGLLSLLLGVTLFLLRYLFPQDLGPYFERLGVLLWYLLLLSVQAFLVLLVTHYGFRPQALAESRPLVRPALLAFCLLLAALAFIAATRLGLTPDPAYWGEPGVPVMGWQLTLAMLLGVGVLVVSLLPRSHRRLDFWIYAALWAVAVLSWLGVPLSVMRNSFYAPIDPPAYQAFPNSDAAYYDSMAQSLLIGYPYQGEIPARPLYIVLLTALHALVGERYDLIIAGQTLVLALIPVAIFLLGRSLHSRTAGAIAAGFAIFREFNSLLISSQTRVSNTKTLLVDLPTLLLIVVACLVTLRWLQRKDSGSALIAGGVFGILLLLRTQAALILPFALILSVPAYAALNDHWRRAAAAFLGAFMLTILPWLLHNYLAVGKLTFDAPFQFQIIASQYRYTGNLDINSIDLQGKSLAGIVLAFVLRDPKFVLGFVSNHFLATQVGGLLALPLFEPYNGLLAPLNMYWLNWTGNLSWLNLGLVICYLVVIAVGLGAAWRRLRWAGLLPLSFSFGYSLANGLGRFSGWRYDLPADWIWYFYFGVGAAELLTLAALILGASHEKASLSDQAIKPAAVVGLRSALPLLGLILVGATPWLAQGISTPRYGADSPAALLEQLSEFSSIRRLGITSIQLNDFAAAPGAALEVGRVLYPRYFSRGAGLASAHPWPAYAPRDFPRLGFILLNASRHDVVLPTRPAPGAFPHGSDAIVLGCQQSDYVEARLVFLVDSDVAYMNGDLAEPCP